MIEGNLFGIAVGIDLAKSVLAAPVNTMDGKNDAADPAAIYEAATRSNSHFVQPMISTSKRSSTGIACMR